MAAGPASRASVRRADADARRTVLSVARRQLEAVWSAADDDADACDRVRRFVEEHGGRRAAESAVRRASASARRTLARLAGPAATRGRLDDLIVALVERSA